MLELIGLVVVVIVISGIIEILTSDEADVRLTVNGKDVIKYSRREKDEDEEENNSNDL